MPNAIPRVFHFVFGLRPQKKPFHLLHYLCLQSCVQVNRPERVYFYFRNEPYGPYWERIRDKLTLVAVDPVDQVSQHRYRDTFVKHYRYAHHADFIRLEKVQEHGGVYADMDTLFVNPLPDRLFDESFVLGREQDVYDRRLGHDRPSLCNAFIMARRQSEFGALWLRETATAFDGTWSGHSGFLPQRLSDEHPDWIHVESVRSFYKHVCSIDGVRMLFEGCDDDFASIYSMHLWHHMWAAWWRRDFTTFHEAKLTEEFVRQVDTTYNLVARRFLPRAGSAGRTPRAQRFTRQRGVTLADRLITRSGLFLAARKDSMHELGTRLGLRGGP